MIGPLDYIYIACMIIIWSLLLYHVLLSYAGYRYSLKAEREKEELDNSPVGPLPTVTVLIPAHNEEPVIEQTLLAVGSLDYPEGKLEILCLNDNSTDDTGAIARATAEKIGKHVKVVDVPPDRGKRGKSAVLNYGLELAKGEVIAVYDADNTPERSALLYLVRNLVRGKGKLGAVIGKFRTRNRDRNLLTRFINLETIFYQWTTQAGRWFLYKLTTIPGTNFVIWKDLLLKLGGWDTKALTEDTELSIRVYLNKLLIKMVPYAITWEEEPERLKVWFKQRTRWAKGNIYVLLKFFFPLLLSGNMRLLIDLFYLLVVYFLFLLSVSASLFIFLLGVTGLGKLVLKGPFDLLWLMAVVLFVVELGITLTPEPGENRRSNLLLAVLMYLTYTQLWVLVVLNAIWQSLISILRGEKTFWYKTERAR